MGKRNKSLPQSGMPGVHWHSCSNKWIVVHSGSYIGLYDSLEEAKKAKNSLKNHTDSAPSGYQQGILMALGSLGNDGRFSVRSIDPWYPEHVQPLFGTKVFAIDDYHKSGRKQYIIRSACVSFPSLDSIQDWQGFCRAWFEIHGGVHPVSRRKHKTKSIYHVIGFRIFGPEHVLQAMMDHLPIRPKKIGKIANIVDGKYSGSTYCLSLQSPAETADVLEWIDSTPRNEKIWDFGKQKSQLFEKDMNNK